MPNTGYALSSGVPDTQGGFSVTRQTRHDAAECEAMPGQDGQEENEMSFINR